MSDSFKYFAYGSCMDVTSLSRSFGIDCDNFLIGRVVLKNYSLMFDYPSTIRAGGLCNIKKRVGSSVEGVLYQLPNKLLSYLDEREGQPRGRYHRDSVTVYRHDGAKYTALVYIASVVMSQELAPEKDYLDMLITGMNQAQLSEDYKYSTLEHIRNLRKNNDN